MKKILFIVVLLFSFTSSSFATCSSDNAYGINPCSPSNSDSERRFKMKLWHKQHREKANKFFQKRLESVRSNRYNWRNN